MGATNLHSILNSLCFNSFWKYAVFWKLKHRARMVLTWEDAYYDNFEHRDPLENKCFSESQEHTYGGHFSHDPLGLAIAKMSYHVYSLGEGIVGQVAVTGKHQWISADKHLLNSFASFEFSDGWQGQFLAGIRTVVVVDVVPYGVVQLGSVSKVVEDMKLVEHIKDAFLALQDPSFAHAANALQYQMKSSLVQKSKREAVELLTDQGNDESEIIQQRSNISHLEDQNQISMKLIADRMYGGDNTMLNGELNDNLTPDSNTKVKDNISLGDIVHPTEKSGADLVNLPINLGTTVSSSIKSDCMDIYLNRVLNEPESSDTNFRKDFEKLESQAESSYYSMANTFLKFSAGSELHEALGPAFVGRSVYSGCEAEKNKAGSVLDMLQDMSSSQMTFETSSENLLEAVVGSVYHGGSDIKSEQSVCKSVQSRLTYEKMLDISSPSKNLVQPAGYSIQHSIVEGDSQNCSSSTDVRGAMSSRGYSSNCTSVCSEQLDRLSEPSKNNKKRNKSGENPRPRPRDRQLIQDRIKELRELVPNGSKCSIDSLLERTIKYMCFLDSITKHADKLNKCESKMHQKELDNSNYDQGSSWAVEVGGHLKVSSIIVENLNKNGQLLVEMLCEECSHFLEIADAIRSLGLTILKGITEVQCEKTWICFVVEGQNNRIMHRMDILWSLVQTLQPKTAN